MTWLRLIVPVVLFQLIVMPAGGSPCDPCFDGDYPSDDDDCGELINDAMTLEAGTFECRSKQLENYQTGCCSRSPRGFCTLCPDGSSFDAGRIVPNLNPEAGDVTCADMIREDGVLDFIFEPGVCSDTFLQRSAAWCGCPTVERQCFLCPDGSRPPMPDLVDPVYYQWSCDAFDLVSSYFNAHECSNLIEGILEFDAAAYCGCPGTRLPGICDLCPDDEEIVNPDLRLGSGSFTCRELALSTFYIPTEATCDRVKDGYHDKGYIEECCGRPAPTHTTDQSGSGGYPLLASLLVIIVAHILSQS